MGVVLYSFPLDGGGWGWGWCFTPSPLMGEGWDGGCPLSLPPLQPPQHRGGHDDKRADRERRGKQWRPVVDHPKVREQPPDQEERQPEYRSREDAEAHASGAALEVRERQRKHHHRQHGRGVEDLVPERDLEA